MGNGESESGGRRPLDRLVRSTGLPVAALLALVGQLLLSTRGTSVARSLAPGLALYLLAAALAVLTLVRRRGELPSDLPDPRAEGDRPAGRWRMPPPGVEWTLVAIVVLGGLYLRVHRIDLIPWGLNNDEAIDAIEANAIAHGRPFSTVTEQGLSRETMFHYVAAAAFRNPGLGLNLLRAMPAVFDLQSKLINDEMMDLIFPLRSVAIGAGALTLLLLYLFARDRFGWRVALLAAIFLAVSPWHLLYSRVGFRAILAPLFAIATLWLFLRAIESGRTSDHAACGLALGLGFWTYTSFRAIPVALVLFLAARRWIAPRESPVRRLARRPVLVGSAIAGLLVILIAAFSHLGLPGFLGRGAYVTLVGHGNYALNFVHALTMTNYFPARYAVVQNDLFISDGVSATYGLIGLEPETAVVAALATLGILYAFSRARRGDGTSALILVAYASLILTVGFLGPSLTRMLMNVPWICLLAALFAWRLFDDIAALRRPLTVPVAAAALLTLTGWGCVQGYDHYFLRAGRSAKAMQYFVPRQTVMGMFVRSLPPGPIAYVLHSYGRETLTYLIGNRPDLHLVTDPSTLDLDAIIHMRRSAAFVVEYSEYSRPFAETLRFLIMRYPQGDMTQVADARLNPDQPIFFTFNLWKDENGQPLPPPSGAPPAGPSPFEMPPGRQPS